MALLSGISSPEDVRKLTPGQLGELAQEIRDFLVENVSRTGGHLGPNLGVVELTIAMHRVFTSPRDTFVFDTGHQSYVHKLLTGRQDFSRLRQKGGLSGYPSRAESEHDVVENSHASTALSWADGIAKANVVARRDDRHVVAVIGDGALTGGMAWEALNNIAESPDRRLVVVVNDNGRSYSPTIGGLANHLATLRTTRGYEVFLDWATRALHRSGPPGRFAWRWMHGFKKGMKDIIAPQGLFEDLGIKYIGPVDGHDAAAMEHALSRAKAYGKPVIVHAITEKGRGYKPAEEDIADRFHAVGVIHPETGLPVAQSRFGWTKVFADEIVRIGRRRPDVVAITAAMLHPVGLAPFAKEFPERTFDVGIAEQHAATSAAGMAYAGLHPVVAVYATFLNRAFDQVLMDVALHKAGVTFVLDRAGITGADGASHNGMWDMAMLRVVPGLRLAAPRDEPTLRDALRASVDIDDAPTVVRYPKGAIGEDIPSVEELDGVDVIGRFEARATSAPGPRSGDDGGRGGVAAPVRGGDTVAAPAAVTGTHPAAPAADVPAATQRVLVVGIGAMARAGLEAGAALAEHGLEATVASPTWVLPVPAALVKLAGEHDLVLTIEDGLSDGGVGALLAQRAGEQGVRTRHVHVGLDAAFLDHASREQIAASQRMTAADAVRDALAALAQG